ncbi:M48 family metallopeptidase [Maribellus maritimus]|uniref:M48 family metallopeptidase n=1 Tax=Maribellus maritimus TaxID=2870838 RepID=UPI001EEC226F|nr:SprT family zinc-dependent metalloprotease [Maribellus maritimus]MCG6188688.1 M48 family metallopeptidase [Maribellus maritimus]
MTNKVVQINDIGKVTFYPNRRSKNIKISVKPDKSVLVSFPYFVSNYEVATFVQKNVGWIRRQQDKFELKKNRVKAGDEIKTKLHTVVFCEAEKNKVEHKSETIKIFVKDFDTEQAQLFIEKVLTEIYRFEAKRFLPERLRQLANIYKFNVNTITIRNNRRNWGSCSSRNNISLNLQMMKLPDELIDYILLHELVHTEIKNHGPEFWKKLNEITDGKARELAKQVKQYSTYTL